LYGFYGHGTVSGKSRRGSRQHALAAESGKNAGKVTVGYGVSGWPGQKRYKGGYAGMPVEFDVVRASILAKVY
jgi:hypothetical protein